MSTQEVLKPRFADRLIRSTGVSKYSSEFVSGGREKSPESAEERQHSYILNTGAPATPEYSKL